MKERTGAPHALVKAESLMVTAVVPSTKTAPPSVAELLCSEDDEEMDRLAESLIRRAPPRRPAELPAKHRDTKRVLNGSRGSASEAGRARRTREAGGDDGDARLRGHDRTAVLNGTACTQNR